MLDDATSTGPSSESLQGRNPREVEWGGAARYGDLGAACDRKYKFIPRAFGDERDHNFDVLA
jgi:hypothetical protein